MFPMSFAGSDGGLVIARAVSALQSRHRGVPVKKEALAITDSDYQTSSVCRFELDKTDVPVFCARAESDS